MNKIEKLEIKNSIDVLVKRNNEIKGLIKAENDVSVAEELVKEIQDNAQKLADLTSQLGEAQVDDTKDDTKKEEKSMNYLKSNNAVKDFFEVLKNSKKEEVMNNWKTKLEKNAITVKDEDVLLPRKIVDSIQSKLLDTNPVFKVFRVTHVGAVIVSQTFGSEDEAHVHVPGTKKEEQTAVLDTANIKPVMVYKLQTISELVKRLNVDYNELYNMVVAELTQAIVNKVVDLALKEGLADGTNGFISVEAESAKVGGSDKIKAITAVADKTIDAVEDAIDFVRGTAGLRYLIVTVAQRKALLAELRAQAGNASFTIKNDDAEIASLLGVDELIVYTGKKDIKITLLIQDAYHVDMADITKIDAFKWEYNENAILIEALSSGMPEKLNGGAVITLP